MRSSALQVLLGHSPKDLVERSLVLAALAARCGGAAGRHLPATILQRRPDVRSTEAVLNAAADNLGTV